LSNEIGFISILQESLPETPRAGNNCTCTEISRFPVPGEADYFCFEKENINICRNIREECGF
jgi:hypothetical protein